MVAQNYDYKVYAHNQICNCHCRIAKIPVISQRGILNSVLYFDRNFEFYFDSNFVQLCQLYFITDPDNKCSKQNR
jgi:hypothetical protein